MNKYTKYLTLKHSWSGINCLTLIELIYKEQLNKSFFKVWQRAEREDGTTNVARKWFKEYTTQIINEIKNWNKISLPEITEYDIIVFRSKRGIINHFGMYIGNNQFIHIMDGCYATISELNDEWREQIYSVCRYKNEMV